MAGVVTLTVNDSVDWALFEALKRSSTAVHG